MKKVLDLKELISGPVILYRPLEKAPYWEPVLAVDSIYELEDEQYEFPVHHIEAGYDKFEDPCIEIFLDIEEV